MNTLEEKFKAIEANNAPGQEIRQQIGNLNDIMQGEKLQGVSVDFSHGDVDAFPPTPNSDLTWNEGFNNGASQAYTEYRGSADVRNKLAIHLGNFTDCPIESNRVWPTPL